MQRLFPESLLARIVPPGLPSGSPAIGERPPSGWEGLFIGYSQFVLGNPG